MKISKIENIELDEMMVAAMRQCVLLQPLTAEEFERVQHQAQAIGFLAISSHDAEHFDPRMDTLLLSQFRKLVAKLIHQQLF